MCKKIKFLHGSFAFCALSLLLLLCSSLGVCFAADWSTSTSSLSDLKWGWFGRTVNSDYVDLSGDGNVSSITPPDNLDRVTLSLFPSSSEAFGLSGELRITSYYYAFNAAASSGIVYFVDGSQSSFDFSADSVGSDSLGVVNISVSVTFPKAVKELAFYFPLSVLSQSPVLGPFSMPADRTVVVGSGSSLSPTYPSFDNSVNSAAGGVVSGYNQLEGDLMDGVASGLSDADSLVTDLPNRFTDYLDGFNFWRDIFNAAFREPFLSFLVMVSLSVGVFCIILKILPKVR